MTSHGRRRRTDDSRRRKIILIAGAAVGVAAVSGVVLVSCSSGSGGGGKPTATASTSAPAGTPGKGGGSTDTASAAAPAKYAKLPGACKAVTAGTVSGLVPEARHSAGTPTSAGDPDTRGTCSWTGNGKDGYQYRWLSVSLQRFTSDPRLGSAEDQARKRYTEQLQQLSGVKGFTASPLSGLGDQANQVTGTQTLAKITSRNDTLLARTGNVVVLVEYNGAGLEGTKNPSAGTVQSGAQQAAKDALAAVAAANS